MTTDLKKFNQKDILGMINEYADCVTSTYGPNGSNVLLKDKYGNVIVTKDGVTVSESISFEDEVQNAVVSILKMSAKETVKKVGDGTTSTVLVAQALLEMLTQSETVIGMLGKLKFKKLLDEFSEHLKNEILNHADKSPLSKTILKSTINISTNGDENVTDVLYDAIVKTGMGSTLIVEEAKGLKTELEFREGYDLPSGYYGPSFVNNKKLDCIEFSDPMILVTDQTIDDHQTLTNIIALVDRAKKPILIIADEVSGSAMAMCAYNAQRGAPIGLVKAPSFGYHRRELLQDLAASVGATLISVADNRSVSDVRLADLGTCRKVISTAKVTKFSEPEGDSVLVAERMDQLKSRIISTEDENEMERLQDRIARLSALIAVVKVGGLNDAERTERKHRVDDALEAVKSVEAKGFVPGGGIFYKFIADKPLNAIASKLEQTYEPELIDICENALFHALSAPLGKLCGNTEELDSIQDELTKNMTRDANQFVGIDFSTGQKVNMVSAGIIEPVELVVNVVTNAIAAVGILATLGYSVTTSED